MGPVQVVLAVAALVERRGSAAPCLFEQVEIGPHGMPEPPNHKPQNSSISASYGAAGSQSHRASSQGRGENVQTGSISTQ